MKKVEVTLKLTIFVQDESAPIDEESFEERIIADIFEPVEATSSFQGDDDQDYNFTYDNLEVIKVK